MQTRVGWFGLANPELAKAGKFFWTQPGIDAQSACGQAPMQSFRDSPKIARPKKGKKLVLNTRTRRRNVSLETSEGFSPAEHYFLIIMEIRGRKRDVSEPIRFDRMN